MESQDYLIATGALLEAGVTSTITPASLHAQLSRPQSPRAVLIDFEGPRLGEVRRLLALGVGTSASRFSEGVTAALLARGICGIPDIAQVLSQALCSPEVHLYARWVPDDEVRNQCRARGVALVAQPLDEIARAALICDRRFTIWEATPRAA